MSLKDLFKPKWKHSDYNARLAAMTKIIDQKILSEIAKNDENSGVRKEAVEKITNQNFLVEIVKNDRDYSIREAAVKNIEDIELLKDIIDTSKIFNVRSTAISKITDRDFISKIVKNDQDWDARLIALEKLEDQDLLAEIAQTNDSILVRLESIEKINNQVLLEDIIQNCSLWKVREKAIGKILDQKLLLKIVQNVNEDIDVRKAAVKKISGQDVINNNLKRIQDRAKKDRKTGKHIYLTDQIESFDKAMTIFAQAINYSATDECFNHSNNCCEKCPSDFLIRISGDWSERLVFYELMEKGIKNFPNAISYRVDIQSSLSESGKNEVVMMVLLADFKGEISSFTRWRFARSGMKFFVCGPENWKDILIPNKSLNYFLNHDIIYTNPDPGSNKEGIENIGNIIKNVLTNRELYEDFDSALNTANIEEIESFLLEINKKSQKDLINRGLFMALDKQNIELGKYFIENGGDINYRKDSEHTLLLDASAFGRIEIVKLLLDKGAIIDQTNSECVTALMKAAEQGHFEIVKMLIDKGADVHLKDKDGLTALMWAARKADKDNQIEIIKLLINKGSDVNIKDNTWGLTALHRAVLYKEDDDKISEIVKLFIDNGANVNVSDKEGKTPLEWAKDHYLLKVRDLLWKAGA